MTAPTTVKEYTLTVSRHHSCEASPHEVYYSAEKRDMLVTALVKAIEYEYPEWMSAKEASIEKCRVALKEAEQYRETKLVLSCKHEEDLVLVVWVGDDKSFGFGESSDGTVRASNKYQNYWVAVAENNTAIS